MKASRKPQAFQLKVLFDAECTSHPQLVRQQGRQRDGHRTMRCPKTAVTRRKAERVPTNAAPTACGRQPARPKNRRLVDVSVGPAG